MFAFGIFCHLLRLMGIYRMGPLSGYFKGPISLFFSSFSVFFFFVFSFLFFIFFFPLSLGGPPLAPGPLDIVHPCHPVATPLTIDTQLRSFYFKLFHRAICTNQFLHKIGRFNSPNCSFCKIFPETLLHLFCQCKKVSPLWDDLCFLINSISEESFNFSVFEKKYLV